MNQIYEIYPYRTASGWAFDDESVGLHHEPFVAGIPEMIDSVVGDRVNVTIRFSSNPFPNYTLHLSRIRLEYGGAWYKLEGSDMEGWLCPALLKYFAEPPKHIYAEIL